MRIIGGTFKGKNFYMPAGIRPTQDLVRRALFDLLGNDMRELTFVDLFAGSGAVGIEALSRGAAKVVFVEKDMRSSEIIEENLTLLHGIQPMAAEIVCCDAFVFLKKCSQRPGKFDVIFFDPPFGHQLAKKTLKTLSAYDIVHADSFIIAQHDKREILPEQEGRFFLIRQRRYGHSLLSIYKGNQ